jgi:hypothetical protein
MRFSRHRLGVRATLDESDARLLRQLAQDLLELVEPPEVSDDPLAALVGMPPGDVDPPHDPVLARLLPDAYRDDPAAAGEFRRFTDADLRAGKRADAQAVLASLPLGGGGIEIDRDQVDHWLGYLNDIRLVLGTALGVTEDLDADEVDPEQPEAHLVYVYSWLGHLQESLLSCVDPRPPA